MAFTMFLVGVVTHRKSSTNEIRKEAFYAQSSVVNSYKKNVGNTKLFLF